MRSNQGRGSDALERIAEQVEKVARQVRWLAYQLRQAGVAEDGLGFAIETLGSERVKRELEQGPPFGVRCRGRAVFAADADELAAWTILAACTPDAVRRRLRGAKKARTRTRRRTRRRPDRRRKVGQIAA